jgi:hypothetical protein
VAGARPRTIGSLRRSSGAALVAAACVALTGCGGSDPDPAADSVDPAPLPGATTCYLDERGTVGDCPVATDFSENEVARADARRQEERFDDQVARLENELDEPYERSDAP